MSMPTPLRHHSRGIVFLLFLFLLLILPVCSILATE
jgi:hypothetical protein